MQFINSIGNFGSLSFDLIFDRGVYSMRSTLFEILLVLVTYFFGVIGGITSYIIYGSLGGFISFFLFSNTFLTLFIFKIILEDQ